MATRFQLGAIFFWVGIAGAFGAGNGTEETFFTEAVQPILAEHCYRCHSHEADRVKGGLMLDSKAGLAAGGDSGPTIAPGKPESSLLVKAVRYQDENLQMPPKGKRLSEEQIRVLEKWVAQGAPWPERKSALRPKGFTDEDRKWWAFQPLTPAAPPAVNDSSGWGVNEVDRFILASLEGAGLRPSPEADRRTLIRRATFDLLGVPPSPEAIAAFESDPAPGAYERLIDRLLEDPRYGERWARHWLDLVRYAESDGYKADDYRPTAWRYRDYVIRSLNEDKPYDRFVQEQLAGDELWPGSVEARTATGFLRLWIYEYNNRDARAQRLTILNDLTDTAGDLFLGLGIQCARCHDHKFDPILQKDYYRLQAFFAPLLPREDLAAATAGEEAEYRRRLRRWEDATRDVRARIEAIEGPAKARAETEAISKFPEDIQALLGKAPAERTPEEEQIARLAYRQIQYEHERIASRLRGKDKETWEALQRELKSFDNLRPAALPGLLTATDIGATAPVTRMAKARVGDTIEPGYLSLLDEKPADIRRPDGLESTGRRSALARWITDPANALTSRVVVNRIWQYHFGRGLVATSSDFGRLGEKPSHPELLDWLARRFSADGWKLKDLHRLLMTSATYRQATSTTPTALAKAKDPENRLLWRMNPARLAAEQIRDSMLAVSGELLPVSGGPAVETGVPRRTVYTQVRRNTRDGLLEAFDAPDGFASTPERNVTTGPAQALWMLNHPRAAESARAFAARLVREAGPTHPTQVQRAYWLAFGRAPTAGELKDALSFLERQTALLARPVPERRALLKSGDSPAPPKRDGLRGDPGEARELRSVESMDRKPAGEGADPEEDPSSGALADFCHVLLNASEFLYVD